MKNNGIIEGPAKVDFIHSDGSGLHASGAVADRLLKANFNVRALRTNDTLLYDEWKAIDTAVVMASQERLVAVKEILARNLTYNIPNGMGKTVLGWQDMSDVEGAELNMDGISKGRRDRPEYDISYLPLPIIHKNFSFSIREIAESRNGNMPLDTTMAALAAQKVSQLVEQIFFQGYSTYTFGGGSIYGVEDYSSINSGSLGAAWDDSSTTGKQIVKDVTAMKQALINVKKYGPFGIFVPTVYETKLDEDYNDNYGNKTIRQRIMDLDNIAFVKVADMCTATKVSMLQLTSDVIRMVIGMPITTLEWDSEGGLRKNFKVMTIMVPQPRKTQESECGIAVYSE